MQDFLAGLRMKIRGPKPGLAAQMTMAPAPRPRRKLYFEVEGTSLKAGVMLLVYPRNGRPHIVHIRRTATGLHHRDQISFPGGQLETGEDPIRAALRETTEEVGVPAAMVEVIGSLTPLYIQPSNFCVYPAVGLSAETPVFKPDPVEVAGIIEIPLDVLKDPARRRTETRAFDGLEVQVPFYGYRSHKIWGATAMILAEFLEILGEITG